MKRARTICTEYTVTATINVLMLPKALLIWKKIQNNGRHKDSKPIIPPRSLKIVSEIKYKISLTNSIE